MGTPKPAIDAQTVVVGMVEEPDNLVQDFSTNHAAWVVLNLLLAKPVRYTAEWTAEPQLLERLPTTANGGWIRHPDGTTEITWHFRRDHAWHDGRPVTAVDALHTLDMLRAMEPPYPHYTVVRSIAEAWVPEGDPYTLVTRWRAEDPIAPFEEWGTVLPAHCFREWPRNLQEAQAHPFCSHPVYNGPFRFVEWKAGEHLAVEAAPPGAAGSPRLSRVLFRFYPDPDALADAVVRGEVDVTELTGFQLRHMQTIEHLQPGVQTHYTPAMLWEHIDFNLDHPWLQDRRVRQALLYAIDRGALVRDLLGGTQPVAHTWLPPRHAAYAEHVATYPYSPARAEHLLTEAGFTRGPDGFMQNAKGERLALTLVTTDQSRRRFTTTGDRGALAEQLKAQLRRVGVDLTIELYPSSDFYKLVRRRGFAHMALFAWSMAPETNGYLLWHSSQLPTQTDGYGINVSGWKDRHNDELLEAVLHTTEPARVPHLLRQQQQRWAEELPALPLFFWPWLTTSKRGLQHVRPVGMFGTYVTWNAHEWTWEDQREASR